MPKQTQEGTRGTYDREKGMRMKKVCETLTYVQSNCYLVVNQPPSWHEYLKHLVYTMYLHIMGYDMNVFDAFSSEQFKKKNCDAVTKILIIKRELVHRLKFRGIHNFFNNVTKVKLY